MAATTAYGDLLNAYVLDFLKKKGFQRTARLFADECRQLSSSPEAAAADGDSTRTAASPPSPDTSGIELPPLPIESSSNGFLAEWWSVFWEFFAVNSGRRSDSFAPSETMLTFAQHLGQHKSLPMQAQLPPGGRRPSLAKFSNANGKRRPSQDESTDNPPPPLLLPDAATEQSKRLRVADTAAGNRSPQSAALVAQYSLPDATDGDAYYHHQIQQMASQGTSGVAAIPHGHGINVGPSGVPIMSENYRDFLADTLKTVAGNNTSNIAPPSSAAAAGGSSTDATTITHPTITHQEYLPTLLNGSGARTEQNSATANTHAHNSSSGSPLSQTQQRAAVSQANVPGMTAAGGRPPENPLLNQQHLAQQQQQQQQILGNRPSAAQFASPHMVNSAAPRVVPTQRTKSYQIPPNGSGQPSAGGAPPGTMVPSFVPGNSFHAMQRLMSPPAMPLSLPTQAQALMTPVVGNAQTQGDIRRASSTSMSYGMQQPGGANAGMQQLGGMTPQLHHPQAPQQVRQHSATPGFAGNPGNGNGVLFTQEFVAAAAAAGMDPQTYANAMMAYAQQQRQQQIQNMSQQQQQHLTQQQMQQIGGGSIMEAGKSEAGSHAAALQQLRTQQSSVPPNEAPMQGRPPISLPTQFSGHQLMMMTKGMADPASVQQHQSQPQQRYMMPFQHQGVMPTPLMGNGVGLTPSAHSSPSTTMTAAPAKQTDAIVIPGGPGVMLGIQSPSATLPSPSAAATAAAAMKKPVPTKAKAKRAPKKTAAGGGAGAGPKSQAAANKASGSAAVGDRGLSPFMGAKPAMTSGGVGGNSGTTSTNASASPALAIKASGAQAFVGISQAAGNDAGLLSSGRLDEGAFSSMLSQRGSKAAVLQPQAGASTGLDFDSTMNAFGSLGQSLEDMFKGHQGMDLHLHEFLDMDNSGNGGDMIDDAMLAYNISDPTGLSSIIGMSTSAAGNNNVLALNLGSLPGSGNNGNTGNGAGGNGGDPGTLLTLPVNHLT